MIYSTLDLYRNANTPLVGTGSSAWHYGGSCLTAQSVVFPLLAMQYMNSIKVKWRVTWNPSIDAGDQQTAVRLVSADPGPTNVQLVKAFFRKNCMSPQNDAVDITAEFKALLAESVAAGTDLQFITQLAGNSTIGPQVYSSALEITNG